MGRSDHLFMTLFWFERWKGEENEVRELGLRKVRKRDSEKMEWNNEFCEGEKIAVGILKFYLWFFKECIIWMSRGRKTRERERERVRNEKMERFFLFSLFFFHLFYVNWLSDRHKATCYEIYILHIYIQCIHSDMCVQKYTLFSFFWSVTNINAIFRSSLPEWILNVCSLTLDTTTMEKVRGAKRSERVREQKSSCSLKKLPPIYCNLHQLVSLSSIHKRQVRAKYFELMGRKSNMHSWIIRWYNGEKNTRTTLINICFFLLHSSHISYEKNRYLIPKKEWVTSFSIGWWWRRWGDDFLSHSLSFLSFR